MVREHMVETNMEHLRPKGQGIVPKGSKIEIRWNSKVRVKVPRLTAVVAAAAGVRQPDRRLWRAARTATPPCLQAATLLCCVASQCPAAPATNLRIRCRPCLR